MGSHPVQRQRWHRQNLNKNTGSPSLLLTIKMPTFYLWVSAEQILSTCSRKCTVKVLYNSDTQVFPMYQVLNFLMLDLSLFNRKIDGNFCLTSQRERGQTSIVILASHLGMPSLVGYSPQGCRVGRDYQLSIRSPVYS